MFRKYHLYVVGSLHTRHEHVVWNFYLLAWLIRTYKFKIYGGMAIVYSHIGAKEPR